MSPSSVLILLVMCKEIFSDNYPSSDLNPKPCTRLNNTVTYQDSLCIPDCNGGFTIKSSQNCEQDFLKKCPEFNGASCEWYNLKFSNGARDVPCCRLKYKAKTTWMEIYYTHQYGKWMTDPLWNKNMGGECGVLPINDVVEVHRKVKKGAFKGRNVPDWPDSVMNAKGERGLNWTVLPSNDMYYEFFEVLNRILNNTVELCHEDKNNYLCSNELSFFMSWAYLGGIDRNLFPKTLDDKNTRTGEEITRESKCIDILVGEKQVKKRGCQFLYTLTTNYTIKYGDIKICDHVYLEANIYINTSGGLEMRYAYWSQEKNKDLIKIICRKLNNPFPTTETPDPYDNPIYFPHLGK